SRVSWASSGALLRAREMVVTASPVICAMVLSVGLPDGGAPRRARFAGLSSSSATTAGVLRCDWAAHNTRLWQAIQAAPHLLRAAGFLRFVHEAAGSILSIRRKSRRFFSPQRQFSRPVVLVFC